MVLITTTVVRLRHDILLVNMLNNVAFCCWLASLCYPLVFVVSLCTKRVLLDTLVKRLQSYSMLLLISLTMD